MMTQVHSQTDSMQMLEPFCILARASSLSSVLAQGFQTAADNPVCEFALVTDNQKARAIEAIADLVNVAQAAIEVA